MNWTYLALGLGQASFTKQLHFKLEAATDLESSCSAALLPALLPCFGRATNWVCFAQQGSGRANQPELEQRQLSCPTAPLPTNHRQVLSTATVPQSPPAAGITQPVARTGQWSASRRRASVAHNAQRMLLSATQHAPYSPQHNLTPPQPAALSRPSQPACFTQPLFNPRTALGTDHMLHIHHPAAHTHSTNSTENCWGYTTAVHTPCMVLRGLALQATHAAQHC